jgi:DNA-binding NtrC family response regulator
MNAVDVRRGRVLMIGQCDSLQDQLSADPVMRRIELRRCAGATGAMASLCARAWDVVLTDPSSSVETTLALARLLSWFRPDVRLIALSPTATNQNIMMAIRAHVFAYFSAPFDSLEIAAVLRTALAASDWPQRSTWCPICHPAGTSARRSDNGSARLVHVRVSLSARVR